MELRVKDVERTVIQVPLRERSRPWVELLVGQGRGILDHLAPNSGVVLPGLT